MSEVYKQTKFVRFKRQLWPPPPKDAVPDWCLYDMLQFHQRSVAGPPVWSQEIPEIRGFWMKNRAGEGEFDHPGHGFKVEYEEDWGWQLVFELTHEEAEAMWRQLFNRDLFHDVHFRKQTPLWIPEEGHSCVGEYRRYACGRERCPAISWAEKMGVDMPQLEAVP